MSYNNYKEYRIGNLIDFGGITTRITSISENSVVASDGNYLHTGMYNPIPITDKNIQNFKRFIWLSGFWYMNTPFCMAFPCVERHANGDEIYGAVYKQSPSSPQMEFIGKVNFLHEIQNVHFDLTGIEIPTK